MKNLVLLNLWRRPPACSALIHGNAYDLAIIDPVPGGSGYLQEARPAFKLQYEDYKYPNIARLIHCHPEIMTDYDYLWFVDDDVEATPQTAVALFENMAKNGLELAQPSLSRDSFASFSITRHVPGLSHRITSIVEIMAPAFSVKALRICLPTFGDTCSGWGLDWVWPELLARRFGRFVAGIVDEVQVRHCCPVSSANWVLPNGKTPGEELNEVLERYDVYPCCVNYAKYQQANFHNNPSAIADPDGEAGAVGRACEVTR